MSDKYWFRASRKGVGWVPVTWQGWWVCALYLFGLIYSFIHIALTSVSASETFWKFLPQFILLSVILIIATYLKGEPLRKKTD